MATKIFRAVILGAPGSGKGTISKRIVEQFGFVHVAPGDILRINVINGTALGKKVKNYIENGQLVPDDLVIKCVLGRISELGNTSWLLDGFPRTHIQATILHSREPVDAVLNLKVPKEVIIERMQGRWIHLRSGRVYNVGFNEPKVPFKDDVTGEDLVQRPDDQPDIVRKRLEIHDDNTKPVIDFYRNLNLVYEFEGSESNKIWPKINKFLSDRTRIAAAKSQ